MKCKGCSRKYDGEWLVRAVASARALEDLGLTVDQACQAIEQAKTKIAHGDVRRPGRRLDTKRERL